MTFSPAKTRGREKAAKAIAEELSKANERESVELDDDVFIQPKAPAKKARAKAKSKTVATRASRTTRSSVKA